MSRNMSYPNNRSTNGQGYGNKISSRPQQDHTAFNDVLGKVKFVENLEDLADDKIFSDYPEELAKLVAENRNANNRTQIRKFYDELVMWDDKVNLDNTEYDKYKVLLKMMKAKIAYSKGRKHIDERFTMLFNKCMDQINSAQKLRQFKLFFEAFMGYYRIEKSN